MEETAGSMAGIVAQTRFNRMAGKEELDSLTEDQKEAEMRRRFEELKHEAYNTSDCCCSIGFCKIIEFFYVLCLVCFFLVVPFLMIYVGVNYQWCEDGFADWLLIGGFLLYAGVLMFIARWSFAKYHCHGGKTTCVTIAFFIILVNILGGLGVGLGMMDRRDEDPDEDPECRLYLFKFPFLLMLSPILIFIIILCGWINSDWCGHGDDFFYVSGV